MATNNKQKAGYMTTIKQQVLTMVKEQVQVRGQDWILGLGYAECNDYAQTIVNCLNVKHNGYYRFETIARYIRDYKEDLKAKQTVA